MTLPENVRTVFPPEERVAPSPTGEVEAVLMRVLRQARREYADLLAEARACGAELVAKSRHVARLEGQLALMGVTLDPDPTPTPNPEEPRP